METYSPVASLSYVRVLIFVAVCKAWSLYQLYIKIAFLHGVAGQGLWMRRKSCLQCRSLTPKDDSYPFKLQMQNSEPLYKDYTFRVASQQLQLPYHST